MVANSHLLHGITHYSKYKPKVKTEAFVWEPRLARIPVNSGKCCYHLQSQTSLFSAVSYRSSLCAPTPAVRYNYSSTSWRTPGFTLQQEVPSRHAYQMSISSQLMPGIDVEQIFPDYQTPVVESEPSNPKTNSFFLLVSTIFSFHASKHTDEGWDADHLVNPELTDQGYPHTYPKPNEEICFQFNTTYEGEPIQSSLLTGSWLHWIPGL